jgi:hypothetical protein
MASEQAFEESVDTERVFVLQCGKSEHVFGKRRRDVGRT